MAGDSGIPGHLPHQLASWWEHGAGAAKIRWATPGDFDRCVRLAVSEAHMDPERAKGFCAERHHAATGMWPAQHAAAEKHAGRAAMATDTKAPYGTSVDYGDPGYLDADGNQASKSGKPGVKRYPLSADKVMAAWSYINQAKNAGQYTPAQLSAIKGRIKAAMDKHGHDVAGSSGNGSSSRARVMQDIRRDCQLEDIHIIRTAEGDSSGRLVEAYAAVFDQPAVIRDHQGHYEEEIDRGAFDERLAQIRSPRALARALRVLYNHGRTAEGDPAPEFQKPLGRPVEVRAEGRGLLTRTEYAKTPHAEEVLELIKAGAITTQSFVGGIVRSDPELRGPGDKYRARNGALTRVRRLALGLREYGPVLWEAYSGAEILGVRMALPGGATEDFDLTPDEESGPGNEGPDTGSVPEDTTSTRYHQHALYALRSKEAREKAGLVWD